MILAGDIGGTKAQLALYDEGAEARKPARQGRFASREHASLDACVGAFLGAPPPPGRGPCSAWPVRSWTSAATPPTCRGWWTRACSRARSARAVTLLNDLEATAWGIGTLGPDDLVTLQAGEEQPGNRALIAAGTGLGEGVLVRHDGRWTPSASEGGHTDFAPRDALEDELLAWLRVRHGRVAWERVLSGPGLADLYRFLRETGRGAESAAAAARFDTAADPAAVVTALALDGSCERARLALERFVRSTAPRPATSRSRRSPSAGCSSAAASRRACCRSCARRLHARVLRQGPALPVLTRIPVRVVLEPQAPLWGAAHVALEDA